MTPSFSRKTINTTSRPHDLETISAEIFGRERFVQHAHSLAKTHIITDHPFGKTSIIEELNANSRSLRADYLDILGAVESGKNVTPAAEWLIDNYHLVEQHVHQTRSDMPVGFYRQLPKLAEGHLAGYPRIFGIVWAYVAHTDSHFDPASLTDFINAYQDEKPLTIGELWAVAISLRLILIENLRRIANRIVFARRARDSADRFADLLLDVGPDANNLRSVFAKHSEPEVTAPFAVQMMLRSREPTALSTEITEWLKQKLMAAGLNFDTAVSEEHHRQGSANVTIRNVVTSLRLISDVNWETWFDSVSLVDKLMRSDANYGAMDFPSRTLYRNAIEEIARGSSSDELAVARKALQTEAVDPGYHLIGSGRKAFGKSFGFKPAPLRYWRDAIRSWGLIGYLSAILISAVIIVGSGLLGISSLSISVSTVIILAILSLFPAADAAIAIVNTVLTKMLDATALPGFALRNGVPKELRTLIVIPTLLTSLDDTDEMVRRLEVHYLSNSDGDMYFALLTDWTDANEEQQPDDNLLLQQAVSGIAQLNAVYQTDRFILLHRKRKWNPQQSKWMGWERKRGKLHELNRLLRGATDTSFVVTAITVPTGVRYVLTLDADTRLPRDAARRLVGKLAHPLNQAKFDAVTGRVISGYGVLQPRVTPSLPVGRQGSQFQRIYSSSRGIDPYVFTVSDIYQDLFAEGSFAGKGIYDVDAFERALHAKIPENTMLSHDLFEGVFARAGLVTDIEVVEEYPERYAVDASRQHRWTRGDWQLLPWMWRWRTSGISPLGLWKMLDNLRRSITPVASVASLLIAWILLPASGAAWWTGFIMLTLIGPPIIPLLSPGRFRESNAKLKNTISVLLEDVGSAAALVAANLLFLGHRAGLMADAIIRTIYRLLFSRKYLLEWTTAAQAGANHSNNLLGSYSLLASSVVVALMTLSIALYKGGTHLMLLGPLLLAWMIAPVAAWQMSKSQLSVSDHGSTVEDLRNLRLVARRTWNFFARFVTGEENMLPPDNFQEVPHPVVAHRTSPTNIGLYLLSVSSAHQFGWIGRADCIGKLEATMSTLKKLEKSNGHLYNWYDTRDLRPLDPKYISTVDSGNLAGHLVALANLCAHWNTTPVDPLDQLDGIADALDILDEDYRAIPDDRRTQRPMRKQFERQLNTLRQSLSAARNALETVSIKLIDFALQAANLRATLVEFAAQVDVPRANSLLQRAEELRATIESHFNDTSIDSVSLRSRIENVAIEARAMALAMDFGFLLDPQRQLLSIGYRVPEAMRDESCYDMLASEARLASFFAIAKGDLRTRHWFRLGRSVTAVKGGAVLMSWSGSMFEYLMPSLVMRAPAQGLLDQTSRLIVNRQIEYGQQQGTPWGISESAFNARDIEFTYQYSNFGVPGLGLKRGLADNHVIAPYATALAAMVAPQAAAANFKMLSRHGGRGEYGFYEALDYTPARLRRGQTTAVVQAYFAHHQGMTIVAILNAVKNGEMRRHFHDEPVVQATELLLQERAPRSVPIAYGGAETTAVKSETSGDAALEPRLIHGLHDGTPDTHLLSNGRYTVLVTAAGGGQSIWDDIAITRWREDAVRENWGSFLYLKDLKSDMVWSTGHVPTVKRADNYEVRFHEEKAELHRQDGAFTTTVEYVVSPEDNSEARRITILNSGRLAREIEVTTYAELVLAPQSADVAHPAFSKLFVQTEYVPEIQTLLATRRRRAANEPEVWAAHFMIGTSFTDIQPQYETDRAKFMGTGRTEQAPISLDRNVDLTNTTGFVLDPVFSIRHRMKIASGRKISFVCWTVVGNSRAEVLDLVDRHRQEAAYDRAMTLAWTQAQIQLRHMQIAPQDAHLYQTLGGHIIYASGGLRPSSTMLGQGLAPQSSLWPQAISGDRPIVLVRIDDPEDIGLVKQLLQAFEYLKGKRLAFDLVILNDRMSSYVQDLQISIEDLVRRTRGQDEKGRIFTLRSDLIAPETLRILPAISRVVLSGHRGDLADQFARIKHKALPITNASPVAFIEMSKAVVEHELEFWNGRGGFDKSGKEYVVVPQAAKPTPHPWINVLSNARFGCHTAADGGGYTWAGNARENQLTAWSNDPVSNPPSEVFYIRDLETGQLMSPTLAPMNSPSGSYRARFGFGYTKYERQVAGLKIELTHCVPLSDSVKVSQISIVNLGSTERRLTLTFYAELVLGNTRGANAPFVKTAVDESTSVMLAQNRWKNTGSDETAFLDMSGQQTSWTADRAEFLGKYGSLSAPVALFKTGKLSKHVGAGYDPCFAMQTEIVLPAGQMTSLSVVFGAADTSAAAIELAKRYRLIAFDDVLAEVKNFWDDTLGAVQVKTPDRAFDIMMNGWLLYQALACRMWARSGFYQASGAYGFRDQLQDSMAFLHVRPELAREQILRAAARQFPQGDVQHWWLPETGMGIRTRISDDTVWLAYCVHHYIEATGDHDFLDVAVPFIEGQSLRPGEHDAFFLPTDAGQEATLYEHCARGLDLRLPEGAHGLPLMGTGDWNDGMNRVGEEGRGESVWLAWFLYKTLEDFEVFAERRADGVRLRAWSDRRTSLKAALEKHGWDGQWYRRAFFDDGSILGSKDNAECQIDAIAQSWSVLSGVAPLDRASQAMDMAYKYLVREQDGLIALFDPPFDKTTSDPGYIKAYPPGIRENGGQYTHGVIWSVFAHAKLGQADKAMQLFSLINPVNHTKTEEDVQTYRVEPYVVAADVYSQHPHVGRGGWTWYTGSAAWLYRAGLEAILGITRHGDQLHIKPCLPLAWNDVSVALKVGSIHCTVRIVRDNVLVDENSLELFPRSDGLYVVTAQDAAVNSLFVVRLNSPEIERSRDSETELLPALHVETA